MVREMQDAQCGGVRIFALNPSPSSSSRQMMTLPKHPCLAEELNKNSNQCKPHTVLACNREPSAAFIAGGDLVLVGGEGCQDFGLLALRYLEDVQGPSKLCCDLIEF